MDRRLFRMLESLLLNINILNEEILRLDRTEQFVPVDHCFDLIAHIHDASARSQQNAQIIERKLYANYHKQRIVEIPAPNAPPPQGNNS